MSIYSHISYFGTKTNTLRCYDSTILYGISRGKGAGFSFENFIFIIEST